MSLWQQEQISLIQLMRNRFRQYHIFYPCKLHLFENLFVTQLITALRASEMDFRISNYRTDAGAEADVILEIEGKTYAIEIKTGGFSKSDLGGLNSFEKFIGKKVQKFVVLPDGNPRIIDDVQILPWQSLMKLLKI